MNSDSYFAIGESHSVCHDYIIHSKNSISLSDGCSSVAGSYQSDWGARLLCHYAQTSMGIQFHKDPFDQFLRKIKNDMILISDRLNLPEEALYASLLTLKVNGPDIHAYMVGDGVFGGKKKNGSWDIHVIEFEGNMPFYPYYYLEEIDVEFSRTVHHYVGNEYHSTTELINVGKTSQFNNIPYEFLFPIQDYEFVFVASDGLSSFTKQIIDPTSKRLEAIPVMDVIEKLLDFKSFGDDFLKRQCNWMFKKNIKNTFKQLDWKHQDDLSLGVIYCG